MKKWNQPKQPFTSLMTYSFGPHKVITGLYQAPLGNVYIEGWADQTYLQFFYNGFDHKEWLDGGKTKLQLARAAGKFYKQCTIQKQSQG